METLITLILLNLGIMVALGVALIVALIWISDLHYKLRDSRNFALTNQQTLTGISKQIENFRIDLNLTNRLNQNYLIDKLAAIDERLFELSRRQDTIQQQTQTLNDIFQHITLVQESEDLDYDTSDLDELVSVTEENQAVPDPMYNGQELITEGYVPVLPGKQEPVSEAINS